MSSFCILYNQQDPKFTVEKLDINIWVLPGLFGRGVLYCDVGIKLRPDAGIPDDALEKTAFKLRLGLPFVARNDIRDLAPLFWSPSRDMIANAVFGNSKRVGDTTNVRLYDDGSDDDKGIIAFCRIDRSGSGIAQKSEESQYSIATLQVANKARHGEANYIRVRFRVDDSSQLWRWHNVSGRRRFAVSDIRVNEFRETPRLEDTPDFANEAVNVERVHCLIIFSSKLMIVQMSPAPRYIRVLESLVWREYVGRRLSKSSQVFVTTYWRGDGITTDDPFRAFLDVERRKIMLPVPTLLMITAAITTILLLLVENQFQVLDGFPGNLFGWDKRAVFWGLVGIGGFVVTLAAALYGPWPNLLNLRKHGRRLEQWWYK